MNQKSIIAILGVVIVILIGTTVYFATINKTSQPVAPSPKVAQQPVPAPAQKQSNQPVTQENKQSYFEIKELGLKFPVDPTVASDIKYEIKKGDDSDSYAVLSSKKLVGKELAGCTTSVNLLKNTGKASDNPDFMSAFPAKQFNGFFVTAAGPQDSCSDDVKVKAMEVEFVDNIIEGLKNVSVITQ